MIAGAAASGATTESELPPPATAGADVADAIAGDSSKLAGRTPEPVAP